MFFLIYLKKCQKTKRRLSTADRQRPKKGVCVAVTECLFPKVPPLVFFILTSPVDNSDEKAFFPRCFCEIEGGPSGKSIIRRRTNKKLRRSTHAEVKILI